MNFGMPARVSVINHALACWFVGSDQLACGDGALHRLEKQLHRSQRSVSGKTVRRCPNQAGLHMATLPSKKTLHVRCHPKQDALPMWTSCQLSSQIGMP